MSTTTKDDILIILGDAGINYHGGVHDDIKKKVLADLPLTIFCIHGNHESRPSNIISYVETEFLGGTTYWETGFPNLLFAKDGQIYQINNRKTLVPCNT